MNLAVIINAWIIIYKKVSKPAPDEVAVGVICKFAFKVCYYILPCLRGVGVFSECLTLPLPMVKQGRSRVKPAIIRVSLKKRRSPATLLTHSARPKTRSKELAYTRTKQQNLCDTFHTHSLNYSILAIFVCLVNVFVILKYLSKHNFFIQKTQKI